jgi:hypothetical protein
MEFKVIDVPDGANTIDSSEVGRIAVALKENIGKALQLECGPRDANTFRKSIRAALSVRGVLHRHDYKTRIQASPEDATKKVLIVWLVEKPEAILLGNLALAANSEQEQ